MPKPISKEDLKKLQNSGAKVKRSAPLEPKKKTQSKVDPKEIVMLGMLDILKKNTDNNTVKILKLKIIWLNCGA